MSLSFDSWRYEERYRVDSKDAIPQRQKSLFRRYRELPHEGDAVPYFSKLGELNPQVSVVLPRPRSCSSSYKWCRVPVKVCSKKHLCVVLST